MAVIGTRGRHIIAEYWGCNPNILNNEIRIQECMVKAAQESGATVVNTVFHKFTPTGVSGVVVVEESHFSIHTWPEEGYAACDFYTCGNCDPEKAIHLLSKYFDSLPPDCLKINRGTPGFLKVSSL